MKARKVQKKNGGKTAASEKKEAKAVRDQRGKFAHGNHLGKRFGDGQPTDLGGRPAVTVRSVARQMGMEQVRLNGKEVVTKLHDIVSMVLEKAQQGDLRAAKQFVEWHGFDEADETLERMKGNPAIGAAVTVDYRQFAEGMDGR
jgi:malate synthase